MPSLVAITTLFLPSKLQTGYYFLVYAIIGISTNGVMVGFMTYALNIAPSRSRPTYIGFMNTLLFPFAFVPLIGGATLKFFGHWVTMNHLFGLSFVSGIISFFVSLRLEEIVREEDD